MLRAVISKVSWTYVWYTLALTLIPFSVALSSGWDQVVNWPHHKFYISTCVVFLLVIAVFSGYLQRAYERGQHAET